MRGVRVATSLLASLLLSTIAYAADALPQQLVGIWATTASEFRGATFLKGQALYLDSDGVGVIVGGPPPIGVRLEATFDVNSNTLSVTMTEGGESRTGSLKYDPGRKIILGNGQEYHRRIDHVSESVRKNLGLEAKSK